MKVLILYRGKDHTSNKFSSTANYFSRNKVDGINIEGINLDKRNPQKLIEKLEDLEVVYVGYDEEWIIDLLKDKFKEVDLRLIQQKTKNLDIAEELHNEYKNKFGYITVYKINMYISKPCIHTESIFKVDYDNMKDWEKNNNYLSYKECQKQFIIKIENEIKNCKNAIDRFQKKIKNYEGVIEKYTNLQK